MKLCTENPAMVRLGDILRGWGLTDPSSEIHGGIPGCIQLRYPSNQDFLSREKCEIKKLNKKTQELGC